MKPIRNILCLLFLSGAQLLSAAGGGGRDTSKSKYPITDPRNPNCPCHQYQAQADREYAKLVQQSEHAGLLEKKGETLAATKKASKVRQRRRAWGAGRNHKPKMQKRKAWKDRMSRCFHF